MATHRIDRPHRSQPRRRGISLIEALVALAVMAFGMLSLVGVQATLRLNSDVSKQRAEATRIATEEIESLRLFRTLRPVNGQVGRSWDEITSRTLTLQPGNTGNTTFTMVRTVINGTVDMVAGLNRKVVKVSVTWIDRAGANQSVVIDAVVAGVDPVLSSLLAVAVPPSASNQRQGRHVTIPVEAIHLGNSDGRSAFKPSESGSVAWLFNNTSGMVTSRCTGVTAAQAAITSAMIAAATCSQINGRLVSGLVQFDLRLLTDGALDAAAAQSPAGPVLPLAASAPLSFDPGNESYVGHSAAAECVSRPGPGGTFAVAYHCLVFAAAGGWGGRLDVALADPLPDASAASDYRVCRYTTSAQYYATNSDHPRTYCIERLGIANNTTPCYGRKVGVNLTNQNFLVIRNTQACPTDVAADPANGDFVNSNTLQHQP